MVENRGQTMMDDEPLDLTSEPFHEGSGDARDPGDPREGGTRPYVGMHFACCAVYARIYLNRDSTAYMGNCPRCGRRVQLRVGPDGTDQRFFTAY